MFGNNQTAYENAHEHYTEEELYMRVWRKSSPIGVLFDVINYVKTSQQYELSQDCQRAANAHLSIDKQSKMLEPVKLVVTRCNSAYVALERATRLQNTFNHYTKHHTNRVTIKDSSAIRRNKLPNAPSWMRSGGLTTAD